MELRHRSFVAVAEAESLTVAAERKLHTSQRFVEPADLGFLKTRSVAQLLTRGAHGIEPTPARR